MLALIFAFLVGCLSTSSQYSPFNGRGSTNSVTDDSCHVTLDDYRAAQFDFHVNIFKSLILHGYVNFVSAPMSTWLILAAMAEGAEPRAQQQIFQFLKLPNDACVRKKYYELTTARIAPGNDVNIANKRILMIDEGVKLNPSWYEFVLRHDLLHVLTAPMRHNPIETVNEINWLLSSRVASLNLNGNSVLLDSMDYNRLWTTAFEDANVVRTPFYNYRDEQIGFVDLMRVKKRAKVGYIEKLSAKLLVLPVGVDGRYTMVFAMFIHKHDIREQFAKVTKESLAELFGSLRESYVPVEIGIPRMVITSEIDMRSILESFGVTDLWRDPAATRHISQPAALPSSYLQRATMVLDTHGVSPSPVEPEYPADTPSGVHPAVGLEFIANKPFVFGLFDGDWTTVLLSSVYSVPTYRN